MNEIIYVFMTVAREGTPIFQTQLHISLKLFLHIMLDNQLKPTPEYKHYMCFLCMLN